MPIDLDDLMDLFDQEWPDVEFDKLPDKAKQAVCRHEFIPLFSTISCRFCGLDIDKVKKGNRETK